MSDTTEDGWVYYARVGLHVKIGWAADVKSRMRQYPPQTELLAVEPGDKSLERERHAQFADALAWGNEWFIPTTELSLHMAKLRRKTKLQRSWGHSYTQRIAATTSTDEGEWVTMQEAANYYRVNVATVRRMVSRGEILAHRVGGRLIRVNVKSLRAAGTPLQYVEA